MKTLLEKFNELTKNEFDYIKLTSGKVSIKDTLLELNFIYPSDQDVIVTQYKEKILSQLRASITTTLDVNIKLKRSYFDFEFFKASFFEFLKDYPSIYSTVLDTDVTCQTFGEIFVVTMSLEKSVYDYVTSKKILKPIEEFIELNFCEEIKIQAVSKEGTNITFNEPDSKQPKLILENPDGRYIRPENVEDFIGTIIYQPAVYIEDATKPKEGIVLCGTIGKIFEIARKPKETDNEKAPFSVVEKKEPRKFFKFLLTDFTGTVNCLFFPTQKNIQQFGLLKEGKTIICRGNLEEDTFKNDGSCTYRIKEISLCSMPKAFAVNRLKRVVPEKYSVVFPKPYNKKQQASLFEQIEQKKENKVPQFVIGKTFCVFDIETTGFNPDFDSIIEIGAVKLVNGIVTETFSTFVDPKIPLPIRIKSLTHIEDSDVAGQPLIAEVLPDFYKFVEGCVIVGHNVQFDYSFISSKGKLLGIYFDNEVMDTLGLARKYVPGLPKYKLESLTKHFNIINKGAHRAIYDAWATAEVFLEIAKCIV